MNDSLLNNPILVKIEIECGKESANTTMQKSAIVLVLCIVVTIIAIAATATLRKD